MGGIGFLLVVVSCQKQKAESVFEVPPLVGSEVNEEQIAEVTGCPFQVLKTETIGYLPTHKFLWVCLDSASSPGTLEKLAHAIVRDIAGQKPAAYHSFTIHFFKREDLKRNVENSDPFAKAEYLPEGGWTEVGRVPIDEYENYQLVLSMYDQ
jgi:hypothetical protein